MNDLLGIRLMQGICYVTTCNLLPNQLKLFTLVKVCPSWWGSNYHCVAVCWRIHLEADSRKIRDVSTATLNWSCNNFGTTSIKRW